MADKLICPFCGEELDPRFDAYHETITSWVCINEKCVSFDWEFPPKAWQALIQAQRDLAKAIDGLKWIANNRLADNPVRVEQLRQYARQILKQIKHKE